MERVLAAGIFAMAISILAGPKFIDFMGRNEFGEHIREEGPADHHVKQGTPTMGGLLIVVSMIIPFLALSHYTEAGLTVFFVTLGCGAIGFIDDWFKVRHRRSLGLNGRWKLLLLAGITAGVGWSVNDIGLSTDDLCAGARLADRALLRLLRAPVPDHRGLGERREPDGRHRRARRRGRDDRADHVHGDERRHVDPLVDLHRAARRLRARPGAPRRGSHRAARSASSGTTPSPPRSSWATPARWRSAVRSEPSR